MDGRTAALRNGRSLHFDSKHGCLGAMTQLIRAGGKAGMIRSGTVHVSRLRGLRCPRTCAQGIAGLLLPLTQDLSAPERRAVRSSPFRRPQGRSASSFCIGTVRAFGPLLKVPLERGRFPWACNDRGGRPVWTSRGRLAIVVGRHGLAQAGNWARPPRLAWAEYID